MGSLISMVMVGGMMGILMIPLSNMATQVARTQSASRVKILYEAEVDRLRRLWSVDQQNFSDHTPHNQSCTFNTDTNIFTTPHSYDPNGQGFNANVTCTIGTEEHGGDNVILAYPKASNNPGQYTDNNLDGFEDKTGLPTHYDQCYSGWKGDGFKHSACDIGISYVIPMYQEIYQ